MNNTIRFFKDIASIPRESGNEEQIAKYLINFAKSRGLFYYEDKYHNVLIKKENNNLPCLILQAHLDMVCVSSIPNFDFKKRKIELKEKDGYLMANNTTLGADNGIGVAQILNILDSNIPCNIEAVFTVCEETTMIGAMNFDTSLLKGKYLLNLDGFEENNILTESAAYYDISFDKDNKSITNSLKKNCYKIYLTGLDGGHSGYDVNKGRGNAILLMAEFLKLLNCDICSFKSGTKNNVFPSSAVSIICTDVENPNNIILEFKRKYRFEYPNLKINYEYVNKRRKCWADSSLLLEFLTQFPSKVLYYNSENMPTTSLNLGVINDYHLEIGLRSSRVDEAKHTLKYLENLANKYNHIFKTDGYQPGFFSKSNCKLIELLKNTCPYSTSPTISLSHITVEVGFFQEKMPDLQVAIISPKILNAHSIKECVLLNSVEMLDIWLKKFIEDFNKR